MKVSKAGKIWLDYNRIHSKKNTVRAHSFVKERFCTQFGDYDLNDLSVDNILVFMNQLTDGRKPQTTRARFTSLMAFLISPKTRVHVAVSNNSMITGSSSPRDYTTM